MQKYPLFERRRHPRVKKALPIKLRGQDYDVVTETSDLSCIGAYCTSNRSIEPMTKVGIVLLLPMPSKNKGVSNKKVEFSGVVVRAEPIKDKTKQRQYNIAIFFNDINEDVKQKISQFVNFHLGEK